MTPKKLAERTERIRRLDRELKKLFPHAKTELNFSTPWEMLVAVELSAQCTDKMVNKITAELFKKYPTLGDYVVAGKTKNGIAAFEQVVKRSGFYHNKTKNILAAAALVAKSNKDGGFGGTLPKTIGDLVRIPGVGRKTATVVLSEVWGIVEGVTVDTHVIRFVQRYDLSDYTDATRIEKDLMQLLPKKDWVGFMHRVIFYGRYLAPARVYDTSKDPLIKIYPPAAKRFRTKSSK